MPTPFGIPLFDPKETYEAPAVTNGLWENNGFRVAYEHLRLPATALASPSSTTIYFLPLINRRTTISQLYDFFGDFFFAQIDLIASFSRMRINRL